MKRFIMLTMYDIIFNWYHVKAKRCIRQAKRYGDCSKGRYWLRKTDKCIKKQNEILDKRFKVLMENEEL